MDITNNSLKNEKHYDEIYGKVKVDSIIKILNNIDNFLNDAKKSDTSWVGFYYNDFDKTLNGKRILELGCGNCLNAAIMSVLGAEVYANDISQKAGDIIEELNKRYQFKHPIKFIYGDFLNAVLSEKYFDLVVGKAFVHHLTNEQEILYTNKIITILKINGVVRYFEPAVNSKILDGIRFMIPVPGRPSFFQKEKFRQWKEKDPHPERDNSSANYRKIGKEYFETTEIHCIGSIERLHRILPKGPFNRKFRRFSYRLEKILPGFVRNTFARSQLIIYKNPKQQ